MKPSEVHRTLVKSPPELWAELSDPGSLARHLGELGEVRITRLEPESLVEWEGEGLSGIVALKPSGWGTKVTLTVARTAPAATPEAPAAGGGEAAAQPPTGPGDEDPSAAQAPSGATAREEEPGPTHPERAAAPGELQPAGPAGQGGEVSPAPDAEVAGIEAVAAEDAYEPEQGDPMEPEAAPATSEHAEPVLDDAEERRAQLRPEPEQTEGPPTRRGFFARLLDRWRRAEQDPGPEAPLPEAAEVPGAALPPPQTLAALLAAETAAALTQLSQPPQHESTGGRATAAGEPDPEPALPAKPAVDSESVAGTAAAEPGPDAAAELDRVPGDVAAAGPSSAASVPEPAPALEAGDPPADADAAPTDGEPSAQPTPAAADLSAELLAAEQSEEEQLRGVLTAVLDRLGAAHHRPFSRA